MTILLIGGTGTVGSRVMNRLIEQGADVRCLTRSEEKAASLPTGVEGVTGDLTKPETLQPAFAGAEKLFLITALSQTETEEGLSAVNAARNAGLKKIVYMSVVMPEDSKHIPHFKSKIPIEDAIKASGLAYTILRPNSFFQNDLRFKDVILNFGIYPQPIGSKGMNSVDVRDIADAAVAALTQSGHDNVEYPVHGPDALTGEAVADIYSRHLNRDVRYGGDDLDAWSQQARQILPAWLVADLKIMYEYFQNNGLKPTEGDFAHQLKAVGHEPRSFDSFVAELAPEWTDYAKGAVS